MIFLRAAKRLVITSILIAYSLYSALASAASILIWPVDPVIESNQNATAVWLENRDSQPVKVQIRVLSWTQPDGEDQYDQQNDIIVSPPFAQIEPGKRQLIRLVKNIKVEDGKELAYRILVDEMPEPHKAGTEGKQGSGVGVIFQMRYSVPLFITGNGLWTKQDYANPRDITTATQPKLSYRPITLKGYKYLEIKNQGSVHAKIASLETVSGGKNTQQSAGLIGYVLPGATAKIPVPSNVVIKQNDQLTMLINENTTPTIVNKH